MGSRIPPLKPEDIHDSDLREILDRAERLSTPEPAWYLTLGHNLGFKKGEFLPFRIQYADNTNSLCHKLTSSEAALTP